MILSQSVQHELMIVETIMASNALFIEFHMSMVDKTCLLLCVVHLTGPDHYTKLSLAPDSCWCHEPDLFACFGIASDDQRLLMTNSSTCDFTPVFPCCLYKPNSFISEKTDAYIESVMPNSAVETDSPDGATLSKIGLGDASDEAAKQRKKIQNRLHKRASSMCSTSIDGENSYTALLAFYIL